MKTLTSVYVPLRSVYERIYNALFIALSLQCSPFIVHATRSHLSAIYRTHLSFVFRHTFFHLFYLNAVVVIVIHTVCSTHKAYTSCGSRTEHFLFFFYGWTACVTFISVSILSFIKHFSVFRFHSPFLAQCSQRAGTRGFGCGRKIKWKKNQFIAMDWFAKLSEIATESFDNFFFLSFTKWVINRCLCCVMTANACGIGWQTRWFQNSKTNMKIAVSSKMWFHFNLNFINWFRARKHRYWMDWAYATADVAPYLVWLCIPEWISCSS